MAVKKRRTLLNSSKVTLGKLLPEALEMIAKGVSAGDLGACYKVVEWVVPKPKPTNSATLNIASAENVELTDAVRLIQSEMLKSTISIEVATNALNALLAGHHILEIADFEQRLTELERQKS